MQQFVLTPEFIIAGILPYKSMTSYVNEARISACV